jgi:hypothetical protein
MAATWLVGLLVWLITSNGVRLLLSRRSLGALFLLLLLLLLLLLWMLLCVCVGVFFCFVSWFLTERIEWKSSVVLHLQ